MYVKWEKPRRWTVRLTAARDKANYVPHHITIGVVSYSVHSAIEAAQMKYPTARVDSVNDTGAIDIVVDEPMKVESNE